MLYIRFGVSEGGVAGVDIIIYIHTLDCGRISLLPMMNRACIQGRTHEFSQSANWIWFDFPLSTMRMGMLSVLFCEFA